MLSLVHDYPVSAALFLVVFFCLLQSWWFKKDFFSPLNIYCFTQCITLAISYFQLDRAMSDFHLYTWGVWLLAMLSFVGGCVVARLYAKTKALPVRIAPATCPKQYNWTYHLMLSFVAFLVFMVGVYGVVHKVGDFIIFTSSPAKWMTKYVDYGYYSLLFNSGPLCVLLFGVASFKKFNNIAWIRRVSFAMVFVTIAINTIAYPNRTSLFLNIGFFLILVNYLYKRISPIVITLFLVFAIIAFVSIGNLRNQYGGSVEGKALDVVVELPYKYLANNYWNLDYVLNPPNDREIHPHTYGIDFFNGIFEYAMLTGAFRRSFRWDNAFNDRIQKVPGLNTVSYLWEVYKDFHLFGVMLLPFLCGLALTVLHLRLCRPFTPRQILLYTYFIYFVGWWFFTAGYKQGIFCIWGMVIFVVSTVCSTKGILPADPDVVGDEVDSKSTGASTSSPILCQPECETAVGRT